MSRTLVAICLALVLGLVSTTYADTTTVFGNWENFAPNMEGWGGAWGSTNVSFFSSTTGVTLDERSLAMSTLNGGSYWQLQYNSAPLAFVGATSIKLDVSYRASEWLAYDEFGDLIPGQGNIWVQFDAVAVQPGWHQVNNTAIDRNTGLAHGKAWNPNDGDLDMTYSWDMTGFSIPTSAEMYFAVQYGGGVLTVGNYYLDNARLITPEPATMALLGLGGLALIRRKK